MGYAPKAEGAELKPVHIGVSGLAVYAGGGGQVDPDLRPGDGRFVVQFVADDVNAKAELIDQAIVEHMGFSDAAEAAVQRNIQREVQVVGTGQASGLDAERIGAERLEGIGIGPEEAFRQTVLAAAKFSIPVRRELVVRELTGIA